MKSSFSFLCWCPPPPPPLEGSAAKCSLEESGVCGCVCVGSFSTGEDGEKYCVKRDERNEHKADLFSGAPLFFPSLVPSLAYLSPHRSSPYLHTNNKGLCWWKGHHLHFNPGVGQSVCAREKGTWCVSRVHVWEVIAEGSPLLAVFWTFEYYRWPAFVLLSPSSPLFHPLRLSMWLQLSVTAVWLLEHSEVLSIELLSFPSAYCHFSSFHLYCSSGAEWLQCVSLCIRLTVPSPWE